MRLNPNLDRINLGCGPNAPSGWLNIDGSWNAWLSNHSWIRRGLMVAGIIDKKNPGAEWKVCPLVHELTKPLPLSDESVFAVYASHVLEHLYVADAKRLLLECRRVLKPGGVLRLVVPDLEFMARDYLAQKEITHKMNGTNNRGSAADMFNNRLRFRSPQPPQGNLFFRLYSLWKDFHYHKWMYDAGSLIQYVEDAGFSGVHQRDYLQSEIPGIAEVELAERVLDGAGICVEGKKSLKTGP